MLKIENLHIKAENKMILNGVNLEIGNNEIHVLMGPNGSGKTTLAQVLMGSPCYEVVDGSIEFNGRNILKLFPNERAEMGMFLSFQHPSEISGLPVSNFLRMIYNRRFNGNIPLASFRKILKEKMEKLEVDEDIINRYLNEGFSGGEKKKMEILQMMILEPKLTVLDEVDSGLDIDALKIVAENVNALKKKTKMSLLIITHYTRILEHINPDMVHIMKDGVIVQLGDKSLAEKLEKIGYAPFGE